MAAILKNVVQSTARSATYNVIVQLSFRLISFIVNAIILRYVSRELLGLVNVRLTLLYSTILFLSREAFRKACLSRIPGSPQRNWRQLINLVWLCVPTGFLSGAVLLPIWVYFLEYPSDVYATSYPKAAFLFAVSAICELLVEPLWLIAQEYHFVYARILIEATALIFKCLSSLFMIIMLPNKGLLGFCVAQVIHAACYILLYYCYFLRYATKQKVVKETDEKNDSNCQEFPIRFLSDILPHYSSFLDGYINPLHGQLVFSFWKQSLLKQFLTEGERYLMTMFSLLSFGQQGVYDVINNLGSLVARFVFLPIEESYYVLFCQVLTRGENRNRSQVYAAGRILFGVLKVVSLIGMIIVVFGFSYSYLALDIYGGKLLSCGEGPLLLRCYCLYVLVIAINGITECFMFALMTKDEIDRYNHRMILFSCIFLVAAFCFTNLFGSVGFIMANCLNMAIRIIHSSVFIQRYFTGLNMNPLYGIIPTKVVLFSLVASFIITVISEHSLCCGGAWYKNAMHIGIGGICLFFVLLAVVISDNELLTFLNEQWTGRLAKLKEN